MFKRIASTQRARLAKRTEPDLMTEGKASLPRKLPAELLPALGLALSSAQPMEGTPTYDVMIRTIVVR